jgi:uracil-DNA glycosylase
MVSAFVKELASAHIGATHNQYADSALRRRRLVEYLESRATARIMLVGEAAGYKGARVSGLAFTSERQLTGAGPSEISATIVHRTLEELRIADEVLLWNLVPTHPHRPSNPGSNRPPTRGEIRDARRFVDALAGAGPSNRLLLAVGRLAQRELGAPYVRHPAHGGGSAFRATLARWLEAAPR